MNIFSKDSKKTLDEILSKKNRPKNFRFCNLDHFLKEKEFPKAFKHTKSEFLQLPLWKRKILIKKIELLNQNKK